MPDYTLIRYEKDGPVAVLTFNRPERLNAFAPDMEEEMFEAMLDAQRDDAVRVLVLTGTGRAFSSGEDVRVIAAGNERLRERAPRNGLRNVSTPSPASPHGRYLKDNVEKPVIAAVNGVAAGGGYALALAADIRIASTNARFAHIYLRRALVTSAEVWYLPRLIGLGPAMQHILMRDDIDAEEALRLNLVSKVVEPDQLMPETMAIAHHIAQGPPVATRFTKKAVYKGMFASYTETMEYVAWARALGAASGEVTEGAAAFLEKRPPNYLPSAGGNT